MQTEWNVTVDGAPYRVELKRNKIYVNDVPPVPLRKLPKEMKMLGMDPRYTITLGASIATLYARAMAQPVLVIDGKNCVTGEVYVHQDVPKWAYIFIGLNFLNLMNGALGGAFAALGAIGTISITTNPKLTQPIKIALSCAILVGAFVATVLIARILLSFRV